VLDLIIRNGQVFDGNGGPGRELDVGIADGTIAALGHDLGEAAEVIDAAGMIVTPGFIDVHSHLDGNATWENQLKPNSGHGITTTIFGNCGVGFAPCGPDHRAFNVALMEGVEDIPAELLEAGLDWSWESYPEYLAGLAGRRFDMGVAGLVPHSCLRVYVMGERAIEGQAATASDIDAMSELVTEAVQAGAMGVGSTRLVGQKTRSGIPAPSLGATLDEYLGLGRALASAGRGVLQMAPEFNQYPRAEEELEMVLQVARETGCPVTYSLKQTNEFPEGWCAMLERTEAANQTGLDVRPQVLGRPTGAIITWDANRHPFSGCPSYKGIADLGIDERLERLRETELKAAIIEEATQHPGGFARHFSRMFAVGDRLDYEPAEDDSVVAAAERKGVPVARLLYDALMADDGRGILLLTSGNYAQFSLDPALAMMRYPRSLPGLGDGGAHCTVICDASATTSMLTLWTRDRTRGERLPLPFVIEKLTAQPARFYGLEDRGRIEIGLRADLNVIDYDRLELAKPRMVYDLPAGARRLVQPAHGYAATLVAGEPVYRNDTFTGALPGRLANGAAGD
jgi:N-acyl-D-aspartate/D-glutamate deacylase